MHTLLRPLLFLAVLGLASQPLLAQTGVAIGVLTPDRSAALDIASSNLGLLAPRVSLTGPSDATTILNPANSLLAYNRASTVNGSAGLVINLGTPTAPNWQRFTTGANVWNLTGNAGTTPATNFLGTTDAQPLAFRVNGLEVGRFVPGGALWVGNNYERNTAIGPQAGAQLQPDYDNEEGINNLFVGAEAGTTVTIGVENTFLGVRSGSSTVTGGDNTYVGYMAGSQSVSYGNTFVGALAGRAAYQGGNNTFLGFYAGQANGGGSENEFIGSFAGQANGGGQHNQFIGSHAGERNTNGNNNTFLGYYAGSNNMTGTGNLFFGYRAGINNTTGSNNIYMGSETGISVSTGSNNIFLGNNAGVSRFDGGNYSNATAIGYYAQVADNNMIALGGGGSFAVKVGIGTARPTEVLHVIGNILASGTITQNSDARLKTNVRPLSDALASVAKLRGVRYTFLPGKGPEGEQVGVIAQEVEAVYPELVRTDPTTGIKSVNYAQLTPVLVEAIKELRTELAASQAHAESEHAATTASLQELREQLRVLQAGASTLVRH